MAFGTRKIEVEILGDASQLERTFKRASRSADKFNSDIGKMGRGAAAGAGLFRGLGQSIAFASGGFLTAGALTAGIKSSVDAASDLNEQMSKTSVVFGKSAVDIQKWAQTTATSFGISERQALATASSFGALFAPIGIVGDEAARQSRALTELGADLASFYNTDVQSALDAIRSGLVGESEPLRNYGVRLSEVRVQQQAMADTGKRNARSLTEQEKAIARIRIIFQDTAKAQGDFGKTSGNLANQTRELKAQVDELKVALGEQLVPALTDAAAAANRFIAALRDDDPVGAFIEGVKSSANLTADLANLLLPGVHIEERFGHKGREAGEALTKGLGDTFAQGPMRPGGSTEARIPVPAGATVEQRNQWFDAMIGRRIDRVQDIQNLRDQIRELNEIAQLIQQRIEATKDITRRLNLEDTLVSVRRQRRSVTDLIHEQTLAAIEERKELERQRREREAAARERALAARAARQFRVLGFGETGGELIPGIENLRKRLRALTERIGGTGLDTGKTRSLIRRIGRVLSGEFGKVGEDVRAKIDEIFDSWNDALKEGRDSLATKFRPVDPNKFVQALGLNLTPAQARRLRGAIAGFGAGGTLPGGATQAFALAKGGVTINGGVNLYGVQNVAQMENEIHKRALARPQIRRGAR